MDTMHRSTMPAEDPSATKVVVVGAGASGLAAASRLASRGGNKVEVRK